jgi:hypothetical protein
VSCGNDDSDPDREIRSIRSTDRTFTVEEQEGDGDKVKLNGVIQNDGRATGAFELQAGTCDTGSVTWTATRRG